MAGLWWITVTMVFCLSAGSLAEIDLDQLAGLVRQIRINIKCGYNINTMYAITASIPKNQNQLSYDLTTVMPNPQTNWNDGILTTPTPRLVVAKIKRVTDNNGYYRYTEHAEWRLLQNLNLEGQDGDLLVFFSYASPCDEKCANPNGNFRITDRLQTLFNKHVWGGKAFVFENIFKPGGQYIDPEKISLALRNIGDSIGSENIFRCYEDNNGNYHCVKCFNGNQINQYCIS